MRQFLLATASSGEGSVAFYPQHVRGNKTPLTTNDTYRGGGTLVLSRTAENGGDIVLPFHTNNFSYSKMAPIHASHRKVVLVFEDLTPAADRGRSYTLILVVKGKKFNERNKYSHSYYLGAGKTVGKADVGNCFKEWLISLNLPISVTGTNPQDVIIESTDDEFDFEIKGADEWFTDKIWSSQGHGVHQVESSAVAFAPAQGNEKHIDELASKAAADRGFEYTFHSAAEYLYPALWGASKTPAGDYIIFTLRFAEPRDMKTRDDVVNQIVQVAFRQTPSLQDAIDNFEALCQMLSTGYRVADSSDAAQDTKGMAE